MSCAVRSFLALLIACVPASPARAGENLARKAAVYASSELGGAYGAAGAVDGKIPDSLSRNDAGQAWCASGNVHPQGVTYTLHWPEPVMVAEVVYYGRTAFGWQECWREYELHVEEAVPSATSGAGDELGDLLGSIGGAARAAGPVKLGKPLLRGTLEMGHGPQRIRLAPPRLVRRLHLRFLSSHGGPNPGAAEIQVYSAGPPPAALGEFVGTGQSAPVGAGAPAPTVRESPELAAALKEGRLGFTRLLVAQRHHVRCSHVYTYHCEGQRNGGGLYVLDLPTGALRELVASPDGQILSCDLDYNGENVLFAWRREGARYQIFRVRTDGAGLTQLTDGPHDNFDPCWLPDGDIVFNSTRTPLFAYCWTTQAGVLHRMAADGSNVQRISANFLNDFTPSVLNDGRIIYGRWEYVDRPAIPIQSLWTINPDGTGLTVFFGNRVLDPATFIEPQAIPGTHRILCTLTGHNGSVRGAIGLIDPVRGNNAQSAIRNVTPDVGLRGVHISSNGPQGPYQTPCPIDEKHFLLSRDGIILLRDYDGTEQTVVLTPRDGVGFYNPRPLAPRARPPVRSSFLKSNPDDWASVYIQDINNGLAPAVRRGEVVRICVVQELEKSRVGHNTGFGFQRPVVSCGATYVPKKVWGFAPVREDGSAYFRVPANVPVYFMALDAQGRAVQRMRSFTHLRPGEVQGCAGCHEPREQTPPRSANLRALLAGTPDELTPPDWGVAGFDYSRVVQPVLDRHCLQCHSARSAPRGIDLSGDKTEWFCVSYDVLAHEGSDLRRGGNALTSWISTMNGAEQNILEIDPKTWGSPRSKLADVLLSGHPDAEGKPRVALPHGDRQRVLTWIDLNVPYYGTSLTRHPELPGGRQLQATGVQRALSSVATRRCAGCHPGGRLPRGNRLRLSNPQNNAFLLAPLAKAAGGTQACGEAVFESTDDPDYQAILAAFRPVLEMARDKPRADMEEADARSLCLMKPMCPGPAASVGRDAARGPTVPEPAAMPRPASPPAPRPGPCQNPAEEIIKDLL